MSHDSYGSHILQYLMLPSLFGRLKRSDPSGNINHIIFFNILFNTNIYTGTFVLETIKTSYETKFSGTRELNRFFISPGYMKNYFSKSSSVIHVDGCHLRTNFAGLNMEAVVMGGDGHPTIIAYARMGAESTDNMEWFIFLLLQCFPGLGIIFSDDAAGLLRLKTHTSIFTWINCSVHAGRNCGLRGNVIHILIYNLIY